MDKMNFLDNSKHYNKQRLLLLSYVFMVCCCYVSCSAGETIIGRNNTTTTTTTMCIEHERQALLSFKQFVNDDPCGMLSSWGDHDNNQNCCEWHGISCSNNGHVTMLKLPGNGFDYSNPYDTFEDRCLFGNIGSSLVFLKQLRYLDLSFNRFTGPIPSFIGSLVNLEYLNLSRSGNSGEIPQQLGNLSKLRSLDLTYDDLDDFSITKFAKNLAWLSRLTSLRTIILSGVDLRNATNWLQVVNNLPFLRVLELDRCHLPPPFPLPLSYTNSSTTLSNLTLSYNMFNDCSIFEWLFNLSGINNHLVHLDLSGNQLECTLPNAFGNLHALSYLDLSYNKLHGNIPLSFGNMQSLTFFNLYKNQLEGAIPDTISTIKPLMYLYLSFNNFQSLPKTLGNFCSLQELYLYANNLTDELPNIIQSLTGCTSKSLLTLSLSENKIRGPIPDSIGTFSLLRELYLSDNQLYGEISPSLGTLSMLEILYLDGNSLKETLSDIHFSNLSRLDDLVLANNPSLAFNMNADWVPPFQVNNNINLSNCRLGSFPKWLLSQTRCSSIDISNAGIVDKVPESFGKSLSSRLWYLNVSHNQIYGMFPDIAPALQHNRSHSHQIVFDLSFNNIEGAIPSIPSNVTSLSLNNNRFSQSLLPFLCSKLSHTRLYKLDLSNNLLSGEIPDCWMKFNLEFLHLENNFFSGAMPSSIGSMTYLKVLHLRNNSFSGGIPSSLEKLTSLVILDLCHNRLSGDVPPWIGSKLKPLVYISLGSNQLVGGIPLSLCQLSSLQILDLSNNNIGGTIPKCISNFTAMRNGTKFLIDFWEEFSPFTFTPYVDAGTIVWKRTEQTFSNRLGLVKAIDISMNKLEGEIPTEISSLKGLVFFNVSGNNLNGGIPPEIGQLTSLDFLDLSINHFVGAIPASLGNLNSLGILNLSNNQLSGEIPQIPRLQSVDASSYVGNPGLCGIPLPNCPWDQTNSTNEEENANHQNDDEDVFTSMGFYISVVLGFIIGFWGVCGTLLLKNSWRRQFFQFVDDCTQKLSLAVSKIIARLPMRH